jgi:chromosome segregation ATPase
LWAAATSPTTERPAAAPLPQIAAAQEDIERLAAARGAAAAEAAEAEAAAQQALEAGHAEVMRLRRRWDELSGRVAALAQERDALAGQIADDKAEWARLQQARRRAGRGGRGGSKCAGVLRGGT